jgi:ribose 5-phosphate isomerase A
MVLAAQTLAQNHVNSGMIIGLGSGSAVAKFAKALRSLIGKGRDLKDISVVPSSMQAWLLARENSLPLFQDSSHCPPSLDIAVDGADQVSFASRSMIKGGGGALLKEKIILSSSKQSYILIDSSKIAERLERPVPIEVVQFAVRSVEERLKRDFKAKPLLRKLDKGYPFFTESGNLILDCQLEEDVQEPLKLEQELKSLPGVSEVGIFNCNVDKFYVGYQDGSVKSH